MSDNQKATDIFEIMSDWKAAFERKPIDTETLLNLMEGETKASLIRDLTEKLWGKSKREIGELLLQELSAKEMRELAASLGMETK